jgi:hypothetical protein
VNALPLPPGRHRLVPGAPAWHVRHHPRYPARLHTQAVLAAVLALIALAAMVALVSAP